MKNLPRMIEWLLVSVALIGLVYVFSPQQLPVSLYKLSLITMASVVGYWVDRSLFPYARPDNPMLQVSDTLLAACMQRRAIIVGCAMLAASLGV
jgi:Putative 2/3 transmembrane domain holin